MDEIDYVWVINTENLNVNALLSTLQEMPQLIATAVGCNKCGNIHVLVERLPWKGGRYGWFLPTYGERGL